MLKLVNVVKTYVMGDSKVEALKGISGDRQRPEGTFPTGNYDPKLS